MDSLLEWANTVDWNSFVEMAISYSYIFFYLPFPLIAVGSYYFFKSVKLPTILFRMLLSVLVTLLFLYYHKSHISVVPEGEIDFELIGAVVYEYIAGAGLALLAICIYTMRSLYSSISKATRKEKAQN